MAGVAGLNLRMPGSKPGALPLGDTPISGERVFVCPFRGYLPQCSSLLSPASAYCPDQPVGVVTLTRVAAVFTDFNAHRHVVTNQLHLLGPDLA